MVMLIERIEPYFEIVIFEENMILNDPIESWPIVDALMGWYSDGRTWIDRIIVGFPLDKAIEYVKLRNPYSLNDLEMQKISFTRMFYASSFIL